MSQILHIDLDAFFVSVERKHDPSLKGKPVIIGGQPTGWGKVVVASREAMKRGVRPGMSLSVAETRCSNAIFLDGAFDRYLDASAAIDELLRDPGLPVEWASIDSIFLDLGQDTGRGGARLGAPRQIAERLQSALREELGFDASCGIATTKIGAQMASRLARPTGLLYVLPGYEERLLAPLDVALLPELPASMATRLHRAGIFTLAQLASVDPAAVEGVIGRRAGEFARLARGLDDRTVDGSAPPRTMMREVTLPEPTQNPNELESVTRYLTETLATRLRRLGCFAQTITVRGRGGDPERTQSRSTTLREATATDADLVGAAHALLHLMRRQIRPVASVAVALSNLQYGGTQLPLFPISPAAQTKDIWAELRSRASMQALVYGTFLKHPIPVLNRRVG